MEISFQTKYHWPIFRCMRANQALLSKSTIAILTLIGWFLNGIFSLNIQIKYTQSIFIHTFFGVCVCFNGDTSTFSKITSTLWILWQWSYRFVVRITCIWVKWRHHSHVLMVTFFLFAMNDFILFNFIEKTRQRKKKQTQTHKHTLTLFSFILFIPRFSILLFHICVNLIGKNVYGVLFVLVFFSLKTYSLLGNYCMTNN